MWLLCSALGLERLVLAYTLVAADCSYLCSGSMIARGTSNSTYSNVITFYRNVGTATKAEFQHQTCSAPSPNACTENPFNPITVSSTTLFLPVFVQLYGTRTDLVLGG